MCSNTMIFLVAFFSSVLVSASAQSCGDLAAANVDMEQELRNCGVYDDEGLNLDCVSTG